MMEFKENFEDTIRLLEQIQISHKQYIEDKSLYLLHGYLGGVVKALEGSSKYIEIITFFSYFQDWIEKKYAYKYSQSWGNILRFCSDGEEEAFELFYKELKLFCENYSSTKPNLFCQNYNSTELTAKERYGKVYVLGEEEEFITFKKEEYNERFYQELWKVLTIIKKRPELILGEKSLYLFKTYIKGFIDTFNRINQKEYVYELYPGFENWMKQKVGLMISRPWYQYLLFVNVSDEHAFDRFYEYLEEYTGEKIEISLI